MKLQYCAGVNSMGQNIWCDVHDRIDEFLDLAMKRNEKTLDEIMAMLSAGREVSFDTQWYAEIRDINAVNKKLADVPVQPKPVMAKCDCGHTVAKSSVMSASLGTSCPDCYDNLSG